MMRTHLFTIIIVEYVNALNLNCIIFIKEEPSTSICDMTHLYWPGQHRDLRSFVGNFNFSAENQFLAKSWPKVSSKLSRDGEDGSAFSELLEGQGNATMSDAMQKSMHACGQVEEKHLSSGCSHLCGAENVCSKNQP